MAVTWTKGNDRWWLGRDPARPKYHLQVWAGGHIGTWSISIDERRIAHGDAQNGDAAKAAAEAALERVP